MIIAIDPDLVKSGVAVIHRGRLTHLYSMKFMELMEFVLMNIDTVGKNNVVVCMENPEANKPVFHRAGTNKNTMLKIAQNVGQVKAVARLIHESLEYNCVTCHKVTPLKGMVKRAKKDAELFKKLTGWEGRSNEDQRDAALIGLYGVAECHAQK